MLATYPVLDKDRADIWKLTFEPKERRKVINKSQDQFWFNDIYVSICIVLSAQITVE